MVATYLAVPFWQPRLGSLGQVVTGLDDIGQCIATILGTVKGQVPHRPDFGLDVLGYIDQPFPKVKPRIVRDILKAIQTYEPRAKVSRVDVTPDTTGTGAISVSLTWRTATGLDQATTEVIL